MLGTRSSTPSSRTADLVRVALSSDQYFWFPGLAAGVVEDFERRHGGRWADAYGTHRWAERNPSASLTSFGAVSIDSGTFPLELLPATDRSDWAALPLAERPAPYVECVMQAAVDAIAQVEGLAESVGCLVRSCTVLEAERGFDMSHSTPDLPRSIFVSVPAPDERDAVFRLAESIIHETMHLQLTLVESVVPLVKSTEAVAFSPWKRRDRPVQGLLHGLYVFAVIDEVLAAFAEVDPKAGEYAARRRAEIASEVAVMGDARRLMTPEGILLWDKLLARVGRPD